MRAIFFSILLAIGPLAAQDYQPKDFNYLIGMPGFNDDLLKMHFQLYQGYVKNINLLMNTLADFSTKTPVDVYEFGALKRRLGWEFDGMRLHELYFENLGGKGGQPGAKSALGQAINDSFGSFANWRADFLNTALIRGIGWVVLYCDDKTGKLVNVWIDQHDVGHFATAVPLLVLDVWEHAYLTQYGLNRGAYVEAFMNNIAWNVVEKRRSRLQNSLSSKNR